MQNNDEHRYDDMLDLPHHVSTKRPQMSLYDRAAQFSAFKALTGYEDAVTEAARVTGQRIELDDASMESLNYKLQMALDFAESEPEITVTYFVADKKKSGGAYVDFTGVIKRIDEYEHLVIFTDKTAIPIDDIYEITGDLFRSLEFESN